MPKKEKREKKGESGEERNGRERVRKKNEERNKIKVNSRNKKHNYALRIFRPPKSILSQKLAKCIWNDKEAYNLVFPLVSFCIFGTEFLLIAWLTNKYGIMMQSMQY